MSYENFNDVIKYFQEVLDIVEKVETPSQQQLTEIEETFQELSDQYWHNYPKKISGKIKTRLEYYINLGIIVNGTQFSYIKQ